MREFSTPMMQQYAAIKNKYQDCLLFFRLGDFYELFLDDATMGAQLLNITLTSRPRGKDGHIPMCGVPFHAADQYVQKLISLGHKVAICEQVTEPDSKGIVEREVVRIITPGTVLDEKSLEGKEHNFVVSVTIGSKTISLALSDVSTGEFIISEITHEGNSHQALLNELTRFQPKECILCPNDYENPNLLRLLKSLSNLNITCFQQWPDHASRAQQKLKEHFSVLSLQPFGLDDAQELAQTAAALLGYLQHTQQDTVQHIRSIKRYQPDDYVALDHSTVVNLELFRTLRTGEKHGSFLSVVDQTITPMGGRLVRNWLRAPLKDQEAIEQRLECVAELLENRRLRLKVRHELIKISDIDRLLSRLTVGLGNAHDLKLLQYSIEKVEDLKKLMSDVTSPLLQQQLEEINAPLAKLANFIKIHIKDEPGNDITGGNIINSGVSGELDELRSVADTVKNWLTEFEIRERELTGIGNLKCGFNSVFGYYIEVSKSHLSKVPISYIRKQTLVNAERFVTEELKAKEEKILHAEEKSKAIEYQLYQKVVEKVLEQTAQLQQVSQMIATLDCLLGFAHLAETNRYCRPIMSSSGEIKLTESRHPVVEQVLTETQFVPNDVLLNQGDHQLIILTGPNMAGKSVYMRQVALIVLLSHIGSYVPAKKATISLVDRIFVRSGANDMIASGLSTFMVEMVETAYILNHATKESLIIMDEIGRGTSTYDGISIAWAVAEHLVNNSQLAAKTLFATHYHELQALEERYPDKIKNYHMQIVQHNKEPIFLHSLSKGAASHSFGVAVAQMAGVPDAVTTNAADLLETLHARQPSQSSNKKSTKSNGFEKNEKIKKIQEKLSSLDINQLTPLEALSVLDDLKRTAT